MVLGRKEDTFAGGSAGRGAEPEGLSDVEEVQELGAVWEGEELVPRTPETSPATPQRLR